VETIVKRAAALDVHKAQVTACVRVPGRRRERAQEVAEFQTTVRGLLALRAWLKAHRVSRVAMEATGVYWKPVWAILEDEFDCLLVNARHVKQVPGRKTDVSDAAWLCQLLEAGLLRRSFVPPKPIRAVRNLTRYRKAQIGERQREANRLHKLLEDTGIKFDCVASDILGASGRAMLDALVAGTTDPQVLAELAKGKLRGKIPALREALVGRFDRQAGKRRSGKSRHGSKWLDSALTEAAMAATRTNDVYLAVQYQRLRPRRGHGRALGAVKHSIITGCWHMLSTGELYREVGGDYFTRRDPDRAARRLVAQLERLGHHVTLEAAAA
jgi:transposase